MANELEGTSVRCEKNEVCVRSVLAPRTEAGAAEQHALPGSAVEGHFSGRSGTLPRNDTKTAPWCRACDDEGVIYARDRGGWLGVHHDGEADEPCPDCPTCCYCGVRLAEHEGDEQLGDLRPEHVRRDRVLGANGYMIVELWAPCCWREHAENVAELERAAVRRDAARDLAEVA